MALDIVEMKIRKGMEGNAWELISIDPEGDLVLAISADDWAPDWVYCYRWMRALWGNERMSECPFHGLATAWRVE